MSEKNEELILEHVSVLSDIHIPTKPPRNKIVFYKGVLYEPHEITLIPTIKIDYNLPELHCYRGKNLTINLIWLCFCVCIGWRQTHPGWKGWKKGKKMKNKEKFKEVFGHDVETNACPQKDVECEKCELFNDRTCTETF